MEQKSKSHTGSIAAEALGYVGSASAGLLTIWVTVRKRFYDTVKSLGWFDKLEETRIKNSQDITETGKGFIEKFKGHSNTYSQEVDKIIATKLETNGEFFKTTARKFASLSRSNQLGIIASGIAVSSVALGATLNLHHKRQIAKELEQLNSRQEAAHHA